jgi:hypothetical protein
MILSDLPSSAEAGFAKAGNRFPLFGIMLWSAFPRRGNDAPLKMRHRGNLGRASNTNAQPARRQDRLKSKGY